MKVLEHVKQQLPPGTAVAIWFKRNVDKGGMPGILREWVEDSSGTYVAIEVVAGDLMYLPFDEIYLSKLHDGALEDARKSYDINERGKAVNEKMLLAQIEEGEQGHRLGEQQRVAPAFQMPPGYRG